MSIKRIIKAMGGGAGGDRRRGEGGNGGGVDGPGNCGVAHKNCSDPSINSYCDRILGHLGKHKCGSCGESF